MGAIHALRIKSPYKLLHVEDIKINCCANEHGTLYLKCLVDDSINYKYSIEASTNDEIIVYEENDDEDNTLEVDINKVDASKCRVLFNGIINSIRTINDNSIYYIEINAVSKSAELDIKKKSRSFQDISMTYDELIGEVLKDYKDKDFIQSVGIGESINAPIFQYEETDWEFLKRICSILDSEIYCDIINLNNLFYFGKSKGQNYEITDDIPYKACKDLKSFYKAGGYDSGYHDTDYFYYEINTREKYNLFDNVYFKQKDSYVSEYSSCKYQDELIYKYKLCRKNGVWQTKIYNSLISGASLEGKVLDTQGEEVKLKLNIDKDDGKSAWFRFAPPTGSAMYSMPVVGTSARLYFPDATSKEPLVTGCVRTNGATCAKTSDTSKRYFGTEHGSEVEMTPSAFNIKGGSASPISISLDDNKGVTITSPSKLTLDADSEIVFKTPKNVKINGVSQINAQKGKSNSGFSLETDLNFLSNNVIKDGSCTESYPDFEDDPEEGEMPEPEPEPEPEEKSGGFNWGGLLVAAVATVAVVASVATFGVGAVVGAALVGAAVGAACAAASTAISDAANGTHTSLGGYLKNMAKGAFVGAISGAIFGPFGTFNSLGGMMAFGAVSGVGDSLLNQAMEGKFSLGQTLMDGLVGAATAGLLHGMGKAITKVSPYVKNALSKASPYVKKAVNKISAKASENAEYAKIAYNNLKNSSKKSVVLGSNLGNVSKKAEDFLGEFKNVKNAAKLENSRMKSTIEVPKFKVKPKFNNNTELKEEYIRQVKGQEEGLNKLTIKEYLDNREAYKSRLKQQKQSGKKNPSGRNPQAARQQQRIRDKSVKGKIKEYTKQGLNREEAERKANSWIKTQAALHDPDQIAGGNPLNVTGMGDKRINSSIGSQWRARADDVEKQVREYIEENNLSEKDIKKIYLNIKLSCGGK